MLIDLDLAKKVGDANSGARHLTGTKQFMALGVLRREDHTYRHDLESFLYVLLCLCASPSWQKWETSPKDEDELYAPILKALDDAIDMLQPSSQHLQNTPKTQRPLRVAPACIALKITHRPTSSRPKLAIILHLLKSLTCLCQSGSVSARIKQPHTVVWLHVDIAWTFAQCLDRNK